MSDSGRSPASRQLGRCLVTGAGGFIGSHVVERLVTDGLEVRALVRYTSQGRQGWLEALDGSQRAEVDVVLGDVRDPDQMRRVAVGCETVFHLAALVGIPYSYESPRQNLDTNAGGTLNVAEAARAVGVTRFVHVSSSEVYGSAQYAPIDELHPTVGQSPYSATKIAAEQIVISQARSFDLPAVVVRPFNTYGPRQSMRAVVPTIIAQALWSDRIRLGTLSTTRDFTFVSDTAAGLIAAASAGGVEGEIFNLGVGVETSIGQLAKTVIELTGRDLTIEQETARIRPAESEVARLISDPRKARRAFAWQPRTSLEDGLRLTIEWLRSWKVGGPVEAFVV